ncbi:ABC transporter substrate-binding protein, partial [Candidatus Bathyarchaeota archaeon]|nr:ABC transporter substrate-binding protein [Candidatus Bathyarchaeota archaeon]
GGLNVGGRKLQVKLIQYDDSSDPSKATALVEQLILQDKVHIIIVPPGPPVISIPVSQAAEHHKIPCLADGFLEAWWGAGPYKYCWTGNLPWFATPIPEGDFRAGKRGYNALFNFLDFTELFRDKINKKIALFALDDADGRTFYELASKVAEEAGYTVVGVEKSLGLYAPGTMDFTAIIREWKDAQAEVLWGMSVGADFATMWRQATSLGWKPKMAMDGRALKNYDDVAAIGGDLAIGLADPFQAWHPSLPYKSYYGGRTCASLAEEWTNETGKAWTEMLTTYHWAEVACRVVEIAGSLDPEKINQAFPQVDFMSIAGRVKIIAEFHSSPSLFHVVQWVKTNKPWVWEAEIVWCADPSITPTHEIIFPLP